jgi:hypothetical protein
MRIRFHYLSKVQRIKSTLDYGQLTHEHDDKKWKVCDFDRRIDDRGQPLSFLSRLHIFAQTLSVKSRYAFEMEERYKGHGAAAPFSGPRPIAC